MLKLRKFHRLLVKPIRISSIVPFVFASLAPLLQASASSVEMPERLLVQSKKSVPAVHSLQGFELVPDTGTTLGLLTFHLRPSYGDVSFLADLIYALRRPLSTQRSHVLVVVRDKLEAAGVYDSLRRRGIWDVEEIVRFRVVERPYYPWARDLYPAYRNNETRRFAVHSAKPGTHKHYESLGPVLMESDTERGALPISFVKHKFDSNFSIPGGDMTSDDRFVYVGRRSIEKIMEGDSSLSEEAICHEIELLTHKEVVILPGQDVHHDRYHMPLGPIDGIRTNLLADPGSTLEIIRHLDAEEKSETTENLVNAAGDIGKMMRPDIEQFFNLGRREIRAAERSSYARSLEEVRETLERRGIRVIRIPTLHRKLIQGQPFPLGFYYINLIQDSYYDWDGFLKRAVVFPTYGARALDQRVLEILKSLGHFDDFKGVPAVRASLRGAGVRCLVQAFGFPPDAIKNGNVTEKE